MHSYSWFRESIFLCLSAKTYHRFLVKSTPTVTISSFGLSVIYSWHIVARGTREIRNYYSEIVDAVYNSFEFKHIANSVFVAKSAVRIFDLISAIFRQIGCVFSYLETHKSDNTKLTKWNFIFVVWTKTSKSWGRCLILYAYIYCIYICMGWCHLNVLGEYRVKKLFKTRNLQNQNKPLVKLPGIFF